MRTDALLAYVAGMVTGCLVESFHYAFYEEPSSLKYTLLLGCVSTASLQFNKHIKKNRLEQSIGIYMGFVTGNSLIDNIVNIIT